MEEKTAYVAPTCETVYLQVENILITGSEEGVDWGGDYGDYQ